MHEARVKVAFEMQASTREFKRGRGGGGGGGEPIACQEQ